MKKRSAVIFAFLVSVIAVLGLTSCKNEGAKENLSEDKVRQSAVVSVEPKKEKIEKEPNPVLSHSLEVVSDAVKPDAYLQNISENINGSQKEIELFKNWIKELSDDSVQRTYGETAYLDYDKPINATLEDSQLIFDKLKAASDHIYVMDENSSQNPYTGGGFIIAIHSDDGSITEITFNGGWLMAASSKYGKRVTFNIENTDGQKLCNEINDIFFNIIKAHEGEFYPKLYEGKKVTAIYAEDRNNHVMVPFLSEEYDQLINTPKEDLTETDSNFAVVIFTEKSKNYLYLKDNGSDALINCKGAIENRENYHPSWLIHFDPVKVTEAIGTQDREKIDMLSDFLKEEVIVERESKTTDGPVNPSMAMGDFFFKMKFASGVEYHISGTDYMDGRGTLSIFTSDLDKTVSYKLKEGTAEKITGFLNENFH